MARALVGVRENEIDRRHLDAYVSESEQQAVFLGNAIEAPGVVRFVTWKIANFFHPVAAPRAGIEVGNHAEWTLGNGIQPVAQLLAADPFRHLCIVGIEEHVDLREQRLLQPVGSAPLCGQRTVRSAP